MKILRLLPQIQNNKSNKSLQRNQHFWQIPICCSFWQWNDYKEKLLLFFAKFIPFCVVDWVLEVVAKRILLQLFEAWLNIKNSVEDARQKKDAMKNSLLWENCG